MRNYITIKEVAEILEKDTSTIRRWIQKGEFDDARKVAGEYEISLKSFNRWWKKNVRR
jgi:excisionase family DNA binding protein